MRGFNKVILLGNLCADPEVRDVNDTQVANMRLATNDEYPDRDTGEIVQTTEYHNVTVWGGLAGVAGKYLSKGDPVQFEGKLQTRSWETDSGETRSSTAIKARNMIMLGSGGGSGSGGGRSQQSSSSSQSDDDLPF